MAVLVGWEEVGRREGECCWEVVEGSSVLFGTTYQRVKVLVVVLIGVYY